MVESDYKKKVSPIISKVCMLISATAMGCVGIFVTALQSYNTFTIVLLRGIFGTLFLTILLMMSHSFSKDFLKETFKLHWKYLLIAGILNPIIIYLYFVNIIVSGYAISAFLLYTHGIIVMLLMMLLKIEKISTINILSFLLAIIGVAIIMEFWTGRTTTLGLILGLLSSLALAILIFCKKKIYLDRIKHSEKIKAKGNFDLFLAWWPTLFIIIMFLPISGGELIYLNFIDIIIAVALGLIPTALAFTLYNIGVKNDKSGNIIILAYIEPIVATINNIIFQHVFSIYVIIGGALILIANIFILKLSK